MSTKLGSWGMPVNVIPEVIQREFSRLDNRPGMPLPTIGKNLTGEVSKFAAKHGIGFDDAVSAFASGNPDIFVIHMDRD